jgi:3-hydroxyisobutyrate dehydrogenase
LANVADAVAGADRVVLMLFGPDSVREVLAEVVQHARPGTLVVDGTTIGPDDAREFGATAAASGLRYVDAPVAGSTGPAAEGTLGVLVGGSQVDYDDALPLLHLWGAPEKVRRVGEVGAGSALKLCVNQGLGVMAAAWASRCASAVRSGWTAPRCSTFSARRRTAGTSRRSGRCWMPVTSAARPSRWT